MKAPGLRCTGLVYGAYLTAAGRAARGHAPAIVSAPVLDVWRGGSRCELRMGAGVCVGGGERGRVQGFSAASRRRLMASLGSQDHTQVAVGSLVTLTYPGEWPGDPARWKRDLDAWLKRLARKHPMSWCWWKLEPQKRGAPHYHLLVFGAGRLDREFVSRSWFEVVASGDERHLQAGTNVQTMASQRAVMCYAAKYCCKPVDPAAAAVWNHPGRWWGVQGRERVPRRVERWVVSEAGWLAIRRLMRRWEARASRHRVYRRADGPSAKRRVGVRVLFPGDELVRLVQFHGGRLLWSSGSGLAPWAKWWQSAEPCSDSSGGARARSKRRFC